MRNKNTDPRRTTLAVLAAGFTLGALALSGLALEGPDKPAKAPGGGRVESMDLALLQQGLLKIYICERESGINETRLHEMKVMSQAAGHVGEDRIEKPSPEQLEDLKKRHKSIHHYLLQEKTNSIQVINLVDRVLGTEPHIPGEGRAERKILEREFELIDIPKDTDFVAACATIEKVLGCKVVPELPPLTNFTIRVLMQRGTGEALIKQVCSSLPMEWRIEDGVLYFRHNDLPAGEVDTGWDEEERKAAEEDGKKK
jgi:hypothetical protein